MTASDDAHVRLFDLATSTTVMKLKAHKVKKPSIYSYVKYFKKRFQILI